MKLPFLSNSSQAITYWPWPSCKHPKTLSFRSTSYMVNAAYIDGSIIDMALCQGSKSQEIHLCAKCRKLDDKLEKCICNENKHQSLVAELDSKPEDAVEEVIRGLKSDDRLFFDPGETRSILEEAKNNNSAFKESVAMVMDSQDPYLDFKMSMNEMVEAYELSDWENLQELLNWYLRVNDKNTHGYVIGAFIDLLVEISYSFLSLGSSNGDDVHGETNSSNSAHDSTSSPFSFSSTTNSTSPCLSPLESVENDVEKEVDSGS